MRVVQCLDCLVAEQVPDFRGDKGEDDVLLYTVLARHRGPLNRQQLSVRPNAAPRPREFAEVKGICDLCNGGGCKGCNGTGELYQQPHHYKLYSLTDQQWRDERIRQGFIRQMWEREGHAGYPPEFYATKDTFMEDAGVCFNKHGRPQGYCIDWKSDDKALTDPKWRQRYHDSQVKLREKGLITEIKEREEVFLCDFCVTGDTPVVTRGGIVPIRDLAGSDPELLVPIRDAHGGLSSAGRFMRAPVKSFGWQTVFDVAMHRGAAKRVVRTTAEHRWVVGQEFIATCELSPGTKLRSLEALPLSEKVGLAPFGVARGFTYGDGTKDRTGSESPVKLTIYDNGKDKALLPYFAVCEPSWNPRSATWHIYGLPRDWKNAPSLDESRTVLFSWLAGYFAADGTVSARQANAVLYSADERSIRVARDIAAICGVRVGRIRMQLRRGFGEQPSPLYAVTLDTRTLPDWFFLIEEHRERAAGHRRDETRCQAKRRSNWAWIVDSVQECPAIEEVFCASVPGVGAFALDLGLMTGNCPVKSYVQMRQREERGMYD